MKFAFFLLSLYALLGTHHARTLNDGNRKALEFQSLTKYLWFKSWKTPPITISCTFTGDKKLFGRDKPKAPTNTILAPARRRRNLRDVVKPKSTPHASVGHHQWRRNLRTIAPSLGEGTYGRVKPKSPPTPSVAPSRGEGTYARVKPKSPPTPNSYARVKPKSPPTPSVAPSRGEGTYGRVKPKSPPTPSVAPSRGEGTYGRVKPKSPPTPSVAPSRGEGTYAEVKPLNHHQRRLVAHSLEKELAERPKSPPTPSVAPSRGEGTYGRVKPKSPPTPSVAPSRGEGTYGRVKPKAPPSPSVAPSRGQATYGGNNPNPKSRITYDKDTNEATGDVIEMITGEQEFQSLDQTTYGRVRKTPPPPSLAPSRGQETFGWVPKSPPTPSGAPSREQGTYGRENPSSDSQTTNELTDSLATPSLKQDRLRDEATYVRDNFITTQLSNDLTRVAPSAPTPPKPNVPSHPTTSESLCVDSENCV
ncbi:hypothetical protein Tco_1464966 [Tanacetum coccineum]